MTFQEKEVNEAALFEQMVENIKETKDDNSGADTNKRHEGT